MLARIPRLKPDELLYSWVARVGVRHHLKYRQNLVGLIWANEHHRSRVDLPLRLAYLAKKAEGILGDGKDILSKATLFPLYAAVLPPERRQATAEAMLRPEPGKSTKVRGLTALRLKTPPSLRFCPECWRADDDRQKERYWRRTHQCPGVFVCHAHQCPLFYSDALWATKERVQEFIPAAHVKESRGRKIHIRDDDFKACLDVAVGSNWLLNGKYDSPPPARLVEAYREAFRIRGLVRPGGMLCPELGDFVARRIGPTLMKAACRTQGWAREWPMRMLVPSRSTRTAYSPLQHLLLMTALEYRAEDFFANMRKPMLLEMTLGPIIARPEPVKTLKAPSPCVVRAAEIKAWWDDPKVSVCEMGRRLGVAAGTVTLHASRSDLPFPRKGLLGSTWSKFAEPPPREAVRDANRHAFLNHRRRFPTMSQTQMMRAEKPGVRWLQKHDREWLKAHRCVKTRKGGAPGIDWGARDVQFSLRVRGIVSDLMQQGEPASFSAVGRALGISLVNIYRRLPLTESAVIQAREKGFRAMSKNPVGLNTPKCPVRGVKRSASLKM